MEAKWCFTSDYGSSRLHEKGVLSEWVVCWDQFQLRVLLIDPPLALPFNAMGLKRENTVFVRKHVILIIIFHCPSESDLIRPYSLEKLHLESI
ncbi:hypothetical protein NPIL_60301 [Nephila pilipes]|uniref:Uncharacterized protein n=1 Tax=Nephila pilipes TaxID=299642 RepID=A0A8X6NZC9_NEPPI|nr:hypothetical protein NPIL_60301 [Nephila pilipes]